jgi:formate/nitrite transporter FocA (FNT family)
MIMIITIIINNATTHCVANCSNTLSLETQNLTGAHVRVDDWIVNEPSRLQLFLLL